MKNTIAFFGFLAAFVTLYGLLNFYFYRKVTQYFSPDPAARVLLALFLLLMVFAPFIVNFSAKAELRSVALVSAYTGYIWMGAVFLFFCVHLLFDAAFVARWVFQLLSGSLPSALFDKRGPVLALSAVIVSAAVLWGFLEARDIRVDHIHLTSGKLPPGHRVIRVAQVSDLHFGVISGKRFAGRVVGMLEEIDADMIVSTGDMIDRGLPDPVAVAAVFNTLDPPMGKYGVAGNHEFYAGIDDATGFHEMAGFTLLRNEATRVSDHLTLAGIDDPAGFRRGDVQEFSRKDLFGGIPGDHFAILLKHQPRPAAGRGAGVDLQLSGHTHKGQIFPFNLVVGLVYPYVSGLHRLEDGAKIYVNRGTGFWGPPIRLFAPPEITVVHVGPVGDG